MGLQRVGSFLAGQGPRSVDAASRACMPEASCLRARQDLVDFYKELLSRCGCVGVHVCWHFVVLDVRISAMQACTVNMGTVVGSVSALLGAAGPAT